MSFLSRLKRRFSASAAASPPESRSEKSAGSYAAPGQGGYWPINGAGWSHNNTAMQIGTAYSCGRLLSTTVGTLPLHVYRRADDGLRTDARDNRLFGLLHDSPNADQTALEYLEGLMLDLLFSGDHIAEKVTNVNGDIVSLNPLDPRQVTVRRRDDGVRIYTWSANGKSREEPESVMFHIRGFGGNQLRGASVISYGAGTLDRARNVDAAADGVFSRGLRPSGVFEIEKFLDEEKFAQFQERVTSKYVGADNLGRPMLLEGGTKFTSMQMNGDDAQLLESRKFSVEEICRLFGVPPFMVGSSDSSSNWGTGIEQQLLGFQKFTLTPWLRRIEQAISQQLIPVKDRGKIYAEFNLDGLLRADSEGRSKFYSEMSMIGAMTVNEIRAKENLPAIDGGDVARVQMQNVPLKNQNDTEK